MDNKCLDEEKLHKLACNYDDSVDMVAMRMVKGEFFFIPYGITETYKAGYKQAWEDKQ